MREEVEGDAPGSSRMGGDRPALPALEVTRLLAAIVDSSDDAIYGKTLGGIITSWNTGAEKIFGYTTAEVVGRSVVMLVPDELRDQPMAMLERIQRGSGIQQYETVRIGKAGRRINVSLTVSPILDNEGRLVGVSTIARDITSRVREEDRWRLLAETGNALSRSLDGEQILRDLARLVARELADYCVTYLVEGDLIRRVGAAHHEPHCEHLVNALVELRPPMIGDLNGVGAVIRTGEPILAPMVTGSDLDLIAGGGAYRRALDALGPISSMIIPLRARERTVGAIAFATTAHSGRHYGPQDFTFGRELADRAALVLDNARLYSAAQAEIGRRESAEAALRSRYEELRILYRIADAVGKAGQLDEVYTRALDGLYQAVGVRRTSILLLDEEGVMRFKAWRGLSDAYRAAVEGQSPWTPDAVAPDPVVISDVVTDPTLEEDLRRISLQEEIRGMAFIPLLFHGQLFGTFMLYFDEARTLTAEEIELTRTIAGTITFGITRLRDEKRILEAKIAAEQASEAKSQFLGIMSHELRTPLNAVLGYADLLLLETKGTLSAGQRHQVERIQTSALHQLGLVDEILTYTRLQAGREEVRYAMADVAEILAEVVDYVRPQVEAKEIRLRLDFPGNGLPAVVDAAMIRQIALNLIGNSAKYTDSGEISVRARAADGVLRVEVSDTGCGIPHDKLEYIFEPFAQVDGSRTRVTAGTGLGLAIVRRFAGLLGGEVTVESTPGQGSTFHMSIPLTPDDRPGEEGAADPTRGRDVSPGSGPPSRLPSSG